MPLIQLRDDVVKFCCLTGNAGEGKLRVQARMVEDALPLFPILLIDLRLLP
jgi:hypothetical protein